MTASDGGGWTVTATDEQPAEGQTPRRPGGPVILGLLLVVAGVILLVERLGLRLPWRELLAGALIVIGLAVVATARRGVPAWLVPAGVVVGIALLVLSAGGVSFGLGFGPAEEETASLQFDEPIQAVDVRVGAGSLEAEGGADGVRAERRVRYRGAEPRITEEVVDGVLRIRVDCDGFLFGGGCQANYRFRVPSGVDVRFSSGSGSLSLSDIGGAVRVDTGSGRVELQRITGPVDAETGSGGITGTEMGSAQFVADTGSGGVDLEFTSTPDMVEIDTGSGGVNVRVPGERYALDLDTGSGGTTVSGITEDADAPRSIQIDTGSGGIVLEGVPGGTR